MGQSKTNITFSKTALALGDRHYKIGATALSTSATMRLSTLLFVFAHVSSTQSSFSPTFYELTVQEGQHGDWVGFKTCQRGYYVCGLRVRYHDSIDRCPSCDQTAINGLAMKCCSASDDGADDERVLISKGHKGKWRSFTSCPDGASGSKSSICGLSTKFDYGEYDYGLAPLDKTGLNGIGMVCCDHHDWYERRQETVEEGHAGKWDDGGSYGTWCQQKDHWVCGIDFRLQAKQGPGADDTAGNGIKIRCCKGPPSEASDYKNKYRGLH